MMGRHLTIYYSSAVVENHELVSTSDPAIIDAAIALINCRLKDPGGDAEADDRISRRVQSILEDTDTLKKEAPTAHYVAWRNAVKELDGLGTALDLAFKDVDAFVFHGAQEDASADAQLDTRSRISRIAYRDGMLKAASIIRRHVNDTTKELLSPENQGG